VTLAVPVVVWALARWITTSGTTRATEGLALRRAISASVTVAAREFTVLNCLMRWVVTRLISLTTDAWSLRAAAPESLFLMMTMTGWFVPLASCWTSAFDNAPPRVADERSIERTAQPPPRAIEGFMTSFPLKLILIDVVRFAPQAGRSATSWA